MQMRQQDDGLDVIAAAISTSPNAPSDRVVDADLFAAMRRTLVTRQDQLQAFYGEAISDQQLVIKNVVQRFPHLTNFRIVRSTHGEQECAVYVIILCQGGICGVLFGIQQPQRSMSGTYRGDVCLLARSVGTK